jgi:hypothetical protein
VKPTGDAKVLSYAMLNQNGTILEVEGRKVVYVGSSYDGQWRALEEFVGGRCLYCNLPLQRSMVRTNRWLCFNKACPTYLPLPVERVWIWRLLTGGALALAFTLGHLVGDHL